MARGAGCLKRARPDPLGAEAGDCPGLPDRGGFGRSLFSAVGPPFRPRVSHHLDHASSPHPAHRTGRAQLRHPALGQGSPVRDSRKQVGRGSVMASEASEPLNGVARLAPISRLSAPSTMSLELGSLPSTGVTRLPRYYEPLRHPARPGLALTGLRLSSRDSPLGASRVASDLRVQACHCQYPGGTPGACRVVRGNPSVSRDDGLPRIATGSAPTSGCFGACTAFTVVAACPLAEPPGRPVVSKASTVSLPPPPLR